VPRKPRSTCTQGILELLMRSTLPLLCGVGRGEHVLDSRLVQADDHRAEVNWVPLSMVTVSGTPKRATQLEMKASTHVLASMFLRRTASNHLVDLSMMVSRPL
jgi:hypothetical protein